MMASEKYTWGEEDLEASVLAYIEMKRKSESNEKFSKLSYYKKLGEKFGRSPKSFEYRMQNISYAYHTLGREWLKGLKPASHVGTNKLQQLIELIFIHDKETFEEEIKEFEIQVENILEKGISTQPDGTKKPIKTIRKIITIARDPKIKAYILQEAKGICEVCEKSGPFPDSKDRPYLEVHHLKPLANGGSDTVGNTVAVCPNCHRELHYSRDKMTVLEEIYKKINRLIKE
ncbi:MAG: HNH endonuclease signature motif containing protein [Serratia marcescens]|uniref:HNH endonuclease n=2 Tax=Serratia TaxID=613 RepID=UPI00074530B6|nr:HNH endonuclease signature motif containing protein [Serratia marcescens]MBN5430050.1 HNH endonuclease [Serratia marcescens]MDU3784100.1 HNH endonuclease signature motif containing protein [Serratia marcescens]CUY26381.1 Predicted restriction endonuclease [Serratia marcescens]CUY57031.1 Predicted restriction endonuclease [Serratia marcescens]CVA89250.1 Predicted restriction endonuclease [Serratia marcescens]